MVTDGLSAAVTVPLTATVLSGPPGVDKFTLPLILPAGAVAAARTYTVALFTVPPLCVRVRLLLYPLPGARDISKFGGAVAVISAINPCPDTVNCWM